MFYFVKSDSVSKCVGQLVWQDHSLQVVVTKAARILILVPRNQPQGHQHSLEPNLKSRLQDDLYATASTAQSLAAYGERHRCHALAVVTAQRYSKRAAASRPRLLRDALRHPNHRFCHLQICSYRLPMCSSFCQACRRCIPSTAPTASRVSGFSVWGGRPQTPQRSRVQRCQSSEMDSRRGHPKPQVVEAIERLAPEAIGAAHEVR